MHFLKRLYSLCLIAACLFGLSTGIKSDVGGKSRLPPAERPIQLNVNADMERAPPVRTDQKDNDPLPQGRRADLVPTISAEEAYRTFSVAVGVAAAREIFENSYFTDGPKALEDWLTIILTRTCGKDEARCSISIAAASAQASMEEHIRELMAVDHTHHSYVLAEAMAKYADRASGRKPTRGIDIAISARDPDLASRYIKEVTEGKEDEHAKVLALVESLEGKHLDMKDLMPGIDKRDPGQGILVRKSLRHQYRTIKEWRLPLALAEGDFEEAAELQKTLFELEDVNTTVGFM